MGRQNHARSQRFGEDQFLSRFHAPVGDEPVGMHRTDHRQSVFGRIILDRMAAHREGSALVHLLLTAPQYIGQHRDRNTVAGKHVQVERQQRGSAHGIDIAQGVGGGDLPKEIGIVDDRREKVDRLDDSKILPYPINGGIIRCIEADHQIGIVIFGKLL